MPLIPLTSESFHNLSASNEDVRIYAPTLKTLIEECRKYTVRAKFDLATSDYVHMATDQQLVDAALSNLVAETQTDTNTRANLLKTIAEVHAKKVGTVTVDGAHAIADGTAYTTLHAVAAASNLATCITLVNALKAWINAHNDLSGVHFNADATSVTITNDPPTTLAHCRTDLNDLLAAFTTHFALGAP